MEKILMITSALEYLENNLAEDLRTDDLAKELHCSKSSIEKLFKFVTNISIKDYSVRRRMSKAAKDIVAFPEDSLLDIGLKYGYGSNEAFTRAFKKVWRVTPSEYRKNPVRYELFPAFRLDPELMEDERMIGRKKVDISELYDFLRSRKNCYFVAADIKSLIPINDVSFEAGDIAILTALNRLEKAAGEEDIVFRIGGDEFVLLTNSEDEEYANSLAKEILSHNGELIDYPAKEIPLSLYVTTYKMENSNIRYSELFTAMQDKMNEAKVYED